MKNVIFVLVLCFLIQGCATTSTLSTFKLVPQTLSGQQKFDQDGVMGVISQKKARVTIRPLADTYSPEYRPTIVVGVYGTEKPFDFSTEDIKIFVDGNPHRVFTYDELVKEIESQRATAIGAIEKKHEDRSRRVAAEGHKSTSIETHHPGGAREGIEDTSRWGSVYDIEDVAAGQTEAESRREAEIEAIETETRQALYGLYNTMIRKTTVSPNELVSGYVTMEKIPHPSKLHEIKVIVSVAGEKHEFLLNYSRVQ